jgi:hypothetical protein
MYYRKTLLAGLATAALIAGMNNASATQLPRISGYVDSLNAQMAAGWACVPNAATPVSIAIYAGQSLLGVFPTSLSRPSAAPICGAGSIPHGFAVSFTPAMQAGFAGQPVLSVYGITAGLPARLLPPSTSRAANPYALPSGALGVAGANGAVWGELASTGTKAPAVALYGGAPYGQGGVLLGSPAASALGNGMYGFSEAANAWTAMAGASTANVPVYGYATDSIGKLVPLMGPTYLPASGAPTTPITLSPTVTQSGSMSGITNTLFTTWMPANQSLGALSGSVSLAGNDSSFAEGLVLVGTTTDSQAACTAKNNTQSANLPSMMQIWAGILKTNGANGAIPVNISLPYGIASAGSAAGTCLMTAVSAGYPFLNGAQAKYTQTAVQMTATYSQTPAAAPQVFSIGLGGEFQFDTRASTKLYTYAGIQAGQTLIVDGISGSVSAAPVAGAPAGTSWLPNPTGAWSVDTSYVYLPAAACRAAGFTSQPASGVFSTFRVGTPAAISLPAGARMVADLPLSGYGPSAVQSAPFFAFTSTAHGTHATLTLNPGDCLVTLSNSTQQAGVTGGLVDHENQSTLYLRIAQ